jgi:hypothetical protein
MRGSRVAAVMQPERASTSTSRGRSPSAAKALIVETTP